MNQNNFAAECVRFICQHYKVKPNDINTGIAVDISQVYSASGIVKLLKEIGFFACELRTNTRGLVDSPKPVIVQTTAHFLVVVDASAAGVTIMEPSEKRNHRVAFPDFVKAWTGAVIVIEPPQKTLSFFEKTVRRFFNDH